ncbi:ribosomal protein S12 methylthiotransferase [Rugosibacter aromaticivorans]|uniref:Ribosomal protein S12 methylthiotransferase n=1 Tax=Rugosibacter aromaticivorans TaxID=1565605 RepID=A0A0C5JCL0_9PROT|nr:30S ribosomal protein S12 methylthiotransferase accessory factor YcaO [Rugosibacter aromaticivorans]AJP49519.1 ribosomal protein S12 methylthiotransferase [Rugosibacter aromaticivorans]TBR13295.1 MAG: 30s ribosomal protein S12 methylthiotransferase accessory protein YcaO [Rugosibacter sp.]
MSETFIPSKDASLESSISTLLGKLESIGFHVIERSWLNEIENIWSVHVTDRDCTRLFSNGKGGSELAARASALGEFFERLSTNYFWTHFYLGGTVAKNDFVHYPNEQWFPVKGKAWPKGILTPELQAFYNPEKAVHAEQLIDLNSGNAERGICTIPYTRLRDGQTVLYPVNLIGNLYVSNGMSAGNTLMEARTQALSEIFERDIKFRIIRDGLCLPDVPEAVINRYPRIAAGIHGLRAAGFGILVKDASLGGEYPVMNVTLLHPQDQGVFASFGAHPRFEVALERALTELLQGRALDSLGDFPAPGFDQDEIADAQNLEIHFVDSSGVISWEFLRDTPDFEFVDWNFSNTTAEDYQWSVDRIHASGHDIFVADFTHLGVYACRMFVPGMSEIYPIEELQWENNTVGNLVRPAILRLNELTQTECQTLLDTFAQLDLAEELPITTLIGLAADADTAWADLRVGELKTLLGLAVGDEEVVLEGCAWIGQFGVLSEQRRRVYRCIENLLQLDDAERDVGQYNETLSLLFGEPTLRQATALVRREQPFFGLNTLGANMEGSEMHQRLLGAYQKVQRLKGVPLN